jgi:hypothetical protein
MNIGDHAKSIEVLRQALETRLCSLESQSSMSANLSSCDVLFGLQVCLLTADAVTLCIVKFNQSFFFFRSIPPSGAVFVQSAQPEGAFGRFLSLLCTRNKSSGGAVAEAATPIPSISSSRLR